MRITTTAMAIVLVVSSSFADAPPSLSYHWSGGHSPYKEITVTISTSGVVRVSGQKQSLPPIDYRTQLAPEEHSALGALVESTGFFSQPEQDTNFAKDVGNTELIIDLNGRRRSLTYRYRPSLEPLTHFIWKLITQAIAIEAIEHDGDIYTATGAVKPTHAGMKALQPDRVKPHFMSYIRTHEDRQKVQWALEAIAWITTPEEFSDFIALGLREKKQRNTLLGIIGTHPFCGNIPESHLKSLCPIFLTFVRDAHSRMGQLAEIDRQAMSDFTRLLGETRYKPSIPMLLAWFEDHKEPYVTSSITPLAKMGRASLCVLIPYLDNQEDSLKLNAIELLMIASRTGPNCGFANPLPKSEYNQMIPVFAKSIVPKLLALSKDDTSVKVRKKSAEAAKEIEQWIKKEEIPTKH